MKTLNIHEAKTHLSRLLDEVNAGAVIVIAKAGKPIAKLVPFSTSKTERSGGTLAGQIWEAPDAWEPDADLNSMLTEAPLYKSDNSSVSARVAEEGEVPYGSQQ